MTKTLEQRPKIQQIPEQNKSGKESSTLINRAVERISDIFTRQSPEKHETHNRAIRLMRGLGFSALRNVITQAPDRLSSAKNTVQEQAKKAKEYGTKQYRKAQEHVVNTAQAFHAEVAENEAYKEKAFRERPAFDSPTFDPERWAELGQKNAMALEQDSQKERTTDYLLGKDAAALRQDINLGHTNPETIPTYNKPAPPRTIGGIALKLFQPGRTSKKD